MKNYLLPILIFLSAEVLYPQIPISFHVTNQEATGCGPFMFYDGSQNIFAFTNFYWAAGSSSICTSENMAILNGTNGITMTSDNFSLAAFQHINTVDPNGNPFTAGEQGDLRHYVGGTMEIYDNGILKFRLTNCRITTTIPYPPPFGDGSPITGSSWGTIDANVSDDAWENELDPSGRGQVKINFSSISPVVQNYCFGVSKYDFDVSFEPAHHLENISFYTINSSGAPKNVSRISSTIVDFPDQHLNLDFASYSGGGELNDQKVIYVNYIEDDPDR